MVVSIHRPTKAIIDLKAIKENVENEVARLPKATDLLLWSKQMATDMGLLRQQQQL